MNCINFSQNLTIFKFNLWDLLINWSMEEEKNIIRCCIGRHLDQSWSKTSNQIVAFPKFWAIFKFTEPFHCPLFTPLPTTRQTCTLSMRHRSVGTWEARVFSQFKFSQLRQLVRGLIDCVQRNWFNLIGKIQKGKGHFSQTKADLLDESGWNLDEGGWNLDESGWSWMKFGWKWITLMKVDEIWMKVENIDESW